MKQTANNIRKDVIKLLARMDNGHTAGSLGIVDVLTALYFKNINHNPRDPKSKDRDRVFISNSHISPAVFATLAHAGYYSKKQLQNPDKLTGHESGIGHGLSIAIGSALAARMNNHGHHTYCIIGDGEHNQGQIWEAILFAGKHKLSNLTVIIDRNNIQADGFTEQIMPLEPLRAKYEAFNWNVIEVDGHNIEHISEAVQEAKENSKPTAIIAHTIPGKGVSFIENTHEWHNKTPTEEEAKAALDELQN